MINEYQNSNMKEARKRANLSYGKLAEIVGITKSRCYRIENCNQLVEGELAEKIAEALGVKVTNIFTSKKIFFER